MSGRIRSENARKARYRRRLEQRAQRNLDLHRGSDARDHLRREQGVPTEPEKLVVPPDPRNAKEIAPDRSDRDLDGAARGDEGFALVRVIQHGWQRVAIDL